MTNRKQLGKRPMHQSEGGGRYAAPRPPPRRGAKRP
jgi:hypothetical protein